MVPHGAGFVFVVLLNIDSWFIKFSLKCKIKFVLVSFIQVCLFIFAYNKVNPP